MNQADSPRTLSDLIGQEKIKENLSLQISAARKRRLALDHVLFCGPPGSGKSTFAQVVANEMGVHIKALDGNSLANPSELATVFTNLRTGDILLIEQIEALRKTSVEVLIHAMEDFGLDIVIGKGSSARSIRIKLPRFTVIVTAFNVLQVDVRIRKNALIYDFVSYGVDELSQMITRLAKQREIDIDVESANFLAGYSNGLLSEASRLLKNVHSYAIVRANGNITLSISKAALGVLFDRDGKPYSL